MLGCQPILAGGVCRPGCETAPDGTSALQSLEFVNDVAIANDGTLAFASPTPSGQFAHMRIRVVTPHGTLRTVASGREGNSFFGDTFLDIAPSPLGVMATVNSPYFGDPGRNRMGVYSFESMFPGLLVEGSTIPSRDGAELYLFDRDGRHLLTGNALTGAENLAFEYDSGGRLARIVDADSNETRIDYSAAGATVTAPFGHTTTLTFDANGYLDSIVESARRCDVARTRLGRPAENPSRTRAGSPLRWNTTSLVACFATWTRAVAHRA